MFTIGTTVIQIEKVALSVCRLAGFRHGSTSIAFVGIAIWASTVSAVGQIYREGLTNWGNNQTGLLGSNQDNRERRTLFQRSGVNSDELQ